MLRVATARFVVLPLAATVTGLTEKAMRRKIEEGVWREDHEYRRGPDGRVYIDMEGYVRWILARSN